MRRDVSAGKVDAASRVRCWRSEGWLCAPHSYNNPVKYVDPSGHCAVAFPFDTAACVIGGVTIGGGTIIAGAAATVALAVVIADAVSPEFNPISDTTTGIVNIINDADGDADEVSDLAREIFKNIAGNVSGNPGDLDPEDFESGSLGDSTSRVKFTDKQIQSKFKHAEDFGIKGNYNKSTAAEFRSALESHIKSPSTGRIEGMFRNKQVSHYYNPDTGINVIVDSNNNFVSGWRLDPAQIDWLLRTGRIGGG